LKQAMQQDSERMIIREARRYLRNKALKETDLTPQEQRDLLFRLIEASFSLTDES
jgi:hypothetical protein